MQLVDNNLNNRVALVIGNAAYTGVPSLANPSNDARDIAAALTRAGFYGVNADGNDHIAEYNASGVSPLLDLDYNSLSRALAAFGRAAENAEQAVLYYAGHGIEVDGENYMIPVDAKLLHSKNVEFETASLMRVLKAVEGARTLRLLIIDACRDNPYRARLFPHRGHSRGLRAIEPYGNILVAYAAKHGTVALDGRDGNSPFAASLLRNMEVPGLEIVDLFRKVRQEVSDKTDLRQEPYLYGALGERREYLVPPKVVLRNPTEPFLVDDKTVEHEHWLAIKSSDNPIASVQFLEKFPGGEYVNPAQLRAEAQIAGCSDTTTLEHLIAGFPDSKLTVIAKQRLATLLWPLLATSKDTAALESFAKRFDGTCQAISATARTAKLRSARFIARKRLMNGAAAAVVVILTISVAALVSPKLLRLVLGSPSLITTTANNRLPVEEQRAAPTLHQTHRPLSPADLATLQAKDHFRDCANCPELVVVPLGEFLMGSFAGEEGRDEDEDDRDGVGGMPVRITIAKPFAVGRSHVTRGQFAVFVASTNYASDTDCYRRSGAHWEFDQTLSWQRPGFDQEDYHPVVCVSWDDASAFVAWLNGKVELGSKPYRLMSEAEAEYIARGFTDARIGQRFYFGDRPEHLCEHGNVADKTAKIKFSGWTVAPCSDGHIFTASVMNYKANHFDIHDALGNVWSWTQDCYAASYAQLPRNGDPFISRECTFRVRRGGSWASSPQDVRTADRGRDPQISGNNNIGFRVARDIAR